MANAGDYDDFDPFAKLWDCIIVLLYYNVQFDVW